MCNDLRTDEFSVDLTLEILIEFVAESFAWLPTAYSLEKNIDQFVYYCFKMTKNCMYIH